MNNEHPPKEIEFNEKEYPVCPHCSGDLHYVKSTTTLELMLDLNTDCTDFIRDRNNEIAWSQLDYMRVESIENIYCPSCGYAILLRSD